MIKRGLSIAMSAVLLFSFLPGTPVASLTVQAAEETTSEEAMDVENVDSVKAGEFRQTSEEDLTVVHIVSAEDFEKMASETHLDSWSKDKKIVLDKDIEFYVEETPTIMTFGGIFDGQGHTISQINITGSKSETGLFGTIQKSGVVRNLNVSGVVTPSGTQKRVGGIAGINYGTISGCSFMGTVEADSETGAIAGLNMESGLIEDCSSEGMITARTSTGGIAGRNQGMISECLSHASVNITYSDTTVTTQQVSDTLENIIQSGQINSTENINAKSDMGGIAGFSSGVITSCKNQGEVGYEHVGYNVGGIVGRTSGFVRNCNNEGIVLGRKDVGGVAGQLQPYMEVDFSEGKLGEVDDQLDILNDLIDTASNDVKNNTNATSESLSRLNSYTAIAKKNVKSMTDETENRVDSAAGRINSTVDTVKESASGISSASSDLASYVKKVVKSIKDLNIDLDQSITELKNFSGDAQKMYDQAVADKDSGAKDIKQEDLDALKKNIDTLNSDINSLNDYADELADLSELSQSDPENASAYMGTMALILSSASSTMQDATTTAQKIVDFSDTYGYGLKMPVVSTATDQINSLKNTVTDTPDAFSKISKSMDLLSGIDLHVNGVSDSFRQSGENLYSALDSMMDEGNKLNAQVTQGVDTSADDLQAVSHQVDTVVQTLKDAVQDEFNRLANPDDEDKYVDDTKNLTEEQIEASTNGRITACGNTAEVSADNNVGGIAGMVGEELDFDPEQDLVQSGDTTLDYIFRTKAIIDHSENSGAITVKSKYAGGIVGHMEMGLASDNTNFGNTEGGDYVGGITGYSVGEIRDCKARSSLGGNKYIGGIAGYGVNLTDNYSMVTVDTDSQYVGAVAGKVKEVNDVDIYGNKYYSETLYGIGGVSYAGIAEGVGYDTMTSGDNGEEFTNVRLIFRADDEVTNIKEVGYGQDLPADEIPAVPGKEGFRGTWNRSDFTNITADSYVDAVYNRTSSVISSAKQRESGRAVVMVEGDFTEGDSPMITSLVPEEDEEERMQIIFPNDGNVHHVFRYLAEDNSPDTHKICKVNADGTKTQLETGSVGKYMTFEADAAETKVGLCVTIAVSREKQNILQMLLSKFK